MAAAFYAEPALTFDLDVFVTTSGQDVLQSLTPLYDALKKKGYAADGVCITIEGVPVQFLPAYNSLVEEALREAKPTSYESEFEPSFDASSPVWANSKGKLTFSEVKAIAASCLTQTPDKRCCNPSCTRGTFDCDLHPDRAREGS